MKTRSAWLSLVLVATIVLSLAGAASTQAQDDAKQLVVWTDENRASIVEGVGAAFEEEYGIKIVVQQMAFGDIRDQLKTAGPAGEGPDILIGAHDWLGELVINGLLAPIDLGDKAEEFAPTALQAFTYDGELYGMPYGIENVAFFRNTDLVPDAPETWEEVGEIAAQLKEEGKAEYGYVIQIADTYHYNPLMTSFGGYIFGLDENNEYDPTDVGVDSEGSIAAATWIDGQIEAGLTPGEADWDTIHALFESGDAAMIITGPWALERIQASGVPYAISPIPDGGKPFLGVQGFMISAFSSEPLLAQAFLTEYLATEDVMQQLFEAGDRPSAFITVADAIEDPDYAAFAEAGAVGQPMPAIPEMSAVWTAVNDAITLTFQQQSDPADAFTTAAEQIRTAIAGEE
ncbi:MAG TPA: maltose ABC transporter substrate-binding protein [Aggregatilinea sp.]|uniref:sugar ABC transporter substrate-binding protein n=1 Tax=Aggregatilinea sp. TaxID=2806333 RepID=UPI002B539A44|nr:maltose ABC transporter substrate-binding protein [Aggregatilinea sp.]HML20274.1 maltose ABC transporter substrate-binding protein [Aggregatilinea sp.]